MVEQELSFSLCLSTSSSSMPAYRAGVRRAIGDPGQEELLELPAYLYIFVLVDDGGSWKILDIIQETPREEDWTKTRYVGLFQTEGDSIYKYNSKIRVLLEGQDVTGRVYAIASSISLTFNKALNTSTITDLSDLLDLKMDVSSDDAQTNLQNIYTTPYNYLYSGVYYGTFSNMSTNVAPLNLLLYHIAAKVDIKWSVEEAKRINKTDPSEAIRLTYMKVKNLLNTSCYAFRPMENTEGSKLASGYEREIIRSTSDYEGLWWEGRDYFYTIPYTVTGNPGYFPLQMEMSTNGSPAVYRPTLNMQVNTSSPFVPWMRAMFNISNNLTDTEETITIDL